MLGHERQTRGLGKSLRSLRRLAAAAAAAVALAACSGDGGGPTAPQPSASDPVEGNFALVTVNAKALPFALFSETGYTLEITASTLAVQTGGQFVMAMTTRETVAGFASTFVDSTRGTWTKNAATVTFTSTESGAIPAIWDGTRLTFGTSSGAGTLALVFSRTP